MIFELEGYGINILNPSNISKLANLLKKHSYSVFHLRTGHKQQLLSLPHATAVSL